MAIFNSLKGFKSANGDTSTLEEPKETVEKANAGEEQETEVENTEQSEAQSEEVKSEESTNNESNDEEQRLQSEKADGEESQKQESNVQEEVSLDEEKVLSYLRDKGLEVSSLDDIKKTEKEEIPAELKSYLEYKKDTNGRSYDEYLELQRDWKESNEDEAIKRYLKEKNPFFTEEDINDELSEFKVDEDIDEDSDIKKKNRNKKKLFNEAVTYLESQKEKYKAPKEGSSQEQVEIPEEYKSAKEKLSEINRLQQEQQETFTKRQSKFLNETKSVFNEDFKGFEFDINGEKKVFKSDEASNLINTQSDVNNFIKKFVGEDGAIKDTRGYHRALNAAMNADKFAKHFYELGASEAIKNETKDSKNINFSGYKSSGEKSSGKKRFIDANETNRNKKRF